MPPFSMLRRPINTGSQLLSERSMATSFTRYLLENPVQIKSFEEYLSEQAQAPAKSFKEFFLEQEDKKLADQDRGSTQTSGSDWHALLTES